MPLQGKRSTMEWCYYYNPQVDYFPHTTAISHLKKKKINKSHVVVVFIRFYLCLILQSTFGPVVVEQYRTCRYSVYPHVCQCDITFIQQFYKQEINSKKVTDISDTIWPDVLSRQLTMIPEPYRANDYTFFSVKQHHTGIVRAAVLEN